MISYATLGLTPPASPVPYEYSVTSEKGSEAMGFDVTWGWQNEGLFVYGTGFKGFSVVFKNNTDKIARIVWERSSITYAGQSYTPFIDGQKYAEASRPMAPTIVPGRGSVEKGVFSAGQPFFESVMFDDWRMRAIPADNVSLIFCVQSSDTEDYYTVTIRPAQ